jgi:hypothetical protein
MAAVGPFILARTYGLFGRAVRGGAIDARTFWTETRQCYGRAWEALLYLALYNGAVSLAALVPASALQLVGIILLMVAVLFTFPWALRMIGGLFVDGRGWVDSFQASFHGPGYGTLVMALGLTTLLYAGLTSLLGDLGLFLETTGMALDWGYLLAVAVVLPIWSLSLYRAEQTLNEPAVP